MEESNTIMFIDNAGESKMYSVPDYCKVVLQVQDGKLVYIEKTERLKGINNPIKPNLLHEHVEKC